MLYSFNFRSLLELMNMQICFQSNFDSSARVSYPALAEIQDDKKRMLDGYRKVIKLTMFVSAICMLSLAAVSEPVIYCLIGQKWHEAASYLPLICISMSLYPLHSINLNMLQIQGRSIFLQLELVKKIIMIQFVLVYLWVFIGC